ncbi:two-component system histidine kinase PnpS [Brassicibacter mesophilus]|uniref:two-component system histidine kinase PnpS n=1 Tax=Brassicibacter mesophilus TaxID=745119 RepID=UPI003D1C2EB5
MQKRIFITFMALVLIGVLITGVLALSLLRVNYLDNVQEKLITNSRLIGEALRESDNYDKSYLNSIALVYSKHTNARVTFIDKDGWVIGDSSANAETLENHKDRIEVQKAFSGQIGVSQRYSESIGRDMLYVAIPFSSSNNDLAVIRLSVSIKDMTVTNMTLFKYSAISMLTGLTVAILLGLRYVKIVTDPIRQLTYATKKISNGNYGEKVYSKTGDELGELSDNFNIMSIKLKSTVGELQESNTKMKAILTSMFNGVIALDNSHRIILINPSAEEIFGISENEVKGKHILEAVRNNVLDDLINSMLYENNIVKNEIEIFEPRYRILSIHSNMIRLNNDPNRTLGTVIIIQDITEIRKLENMRKDFVANVSHELKTPLTSIKGFVETLKEGAAENKNIRDKFLDIIDIEASRLTSLIQDLLLLSEIENKNNLPSKETIDVNKSIDEVMQMLSEIAKQKDIELIDKVNKNLPSLQGNSGWFKQMLINLIDNGIKYTPNGGNVVVTAYSVSGKIYIKVSDTGIGIEKEHLSRLFERFYRVDKARSRQVGGTGLGLAIVKHIIIALRGNIDVKSEINKGTEFIISLPLSNNSSNM